MVPRKDNLSARALQTKWCWYCQDYQSFDHFRKNLSRKDGLAGECPAYWSNFKKNQTTEEFRDQISARYNRMPSQKTCPDCENIFDKSEFYSAAGRTFIYAQCRACRRARNNARNAADRGKMRTYARLRYRKNPDQIRSAETERKRRDKATTLIRYSSDPPACACCRESHLEFLTIDHANGDGAAHRRQIGNASIYGWLRRNAYPEGFRVLCMNCNWSFGTWGHCPHGVLPPVPLLSTRRKRTVAP